MTEVAAAPSTQEAAQAVAPPAEPPAGVEYADFGRYLTQQRELRGLSLDEIQKATRIPLAILTALEQGEVERLPARVFIHNYIRAYAHAIGVLPEDAVLRFEEIDRTVKAQPTPAALERIRRRRAWLTLLGVVILLGAGISFLFWTMGGAPPHHQ